MPITLNSEQYGPMTALISLDYTPVKSKSKFMKAIVEMHHSYERQGQEKTRYIGSLISDNKLLEKSDGADVEDEAGKKGKWGFLNYLLGFITFGMVMYFMKLMKKNAPASSRGSKGGGLFGNKGGRGGGFGSKGGSRLGGGSGSRYGGGGGISRRGRR